MVTKITLDAAGEAAAIVKATEAQGGTTTEVVADVPAVVEKSADGAAPAGEVAAGDAAADETGEQKPLDVEVGADGKLDFTGLFTELSENGGSLTEASHGKVTAALTAAGFPAELLDTYIEGVRAIGQQREHAMYEKAGGKEGYQAMIAWAKTNLSDADAAGYDQSISGSIAMSQLAVEGLHARFKAATGEKTPVVKPVTEPSLKSTARPAQGGGTPAIASRAALVVQMQDPRYQSDVAFRESIQAQLKLAMESGNYRQND